jgi:predicted RecB family nuclease
MQKHADGTIVVSASDLVGFLACDHLATLELGRIAGRWDKPFREDPELELMQERGYAHEAAYLERLRADGRSIHEIATGDLRTPDELRAAEAETVAAMRAGREVIYQATFFDGHWRGHADFLLRVETPSDLGSWSYEIADTKLTRRVKAAAILQMCVYADRLSQLQGVAPRDIVVVTGDGAEHRERLADYTAFYRAAKARFEARVFDDGPNFETYPDPVEHCRVCAWYPTCADRRRADDHLSLVAGMTRSATQRLVAAELPTLASLGDAPAGLTVRDVNPGAYARLHDQARIQLEGRRTGSLRYELLPLSEEPNRGLAGLPEPSPLDVFFDIEADPWAVDGGIEYLFGWVEEVEGQGVFHELWAHEPAEEKVMFEAFIDVVMERLARDPAMHVYHYAPYEPTALKRLMSRYATREEEVDRILRGNVLVDLYGIVRQSLQASVESYSIKKIEKFYMPQREGAVTSAGFSVVEYERWLKTRDPAILAAIASYNRDDCLSNWLLRGWLERLRREAEAEFGVVLGRPQMVSGEASDAVTAAQAETIRRIEALAGDAPVDPAERTPEQAGRWLLAQLLDWHRRNDKPAWWDYFRLRKLSPEELVDEAEPIGDLTYVGVVGAEKKSLVHRYTFPPQDHKLSGPGTGWQDEIGRGVRIHAVDLDHGQVDLLRGRLDDGGHPRALVRGGPLDARVLRDALGRIADRTIEAGIEGDGPYRAARELVLGQPPRIAGHKAGLPLVRDGESTLDAARRIVLDLDRTVLPVQGPPGTGKTWLGARMIVEAVQSGRRVGITAGTHKAITNLLVATAEAATEARLRVRAIQRCDSDADAADLEGVERATDNAAVERALQDGSVDIVAGTPWLFARDEMEGLVDVLFVDEAGQMSLANVVAMGGAASSIVLRPPDTPPPLGPPARPPPRPRPVPAQDLPDAPGGQWLRIRDVLRRPGRAGPRQCPPGDRVGACRRGHGHPVLAGGPRRTHFALQRRGRDRGRPGRLARRPSVDGPPRGDPQAEPGGHRGRGALQRPGGRDPPGDRTADRGARPCRHRGQVPGPGGAGGHLLDGHLVAGRRAARPRVPVLGQSAQRRRVASPRSGHPGFQPGPVHRPCPDARADAPGERVLPTGRGGRRAGRRPTRRRFRQGSARGIHGQSGVKRESVRSSSTIQAASTRAHASTSASGTRSSAL